MADYVVTDNRRFVPGIEHLPIQNGGVAEAMARTPIEQAVPGVKPYERPEGEVELTYDLGPLRLLWGEAIRHHTIYGESRRWLDGFKEVLPAYTKQATLLTLHGSEVATYRPNGQLKFKELEREQPDLVAKYTRMQSRLTFDEEAFKREHPEVHAAYRARRLVFVSAPKAQIALP